LTDLLLARGFEVIVLDNLITGSLDNISHLENDERLTFLQADVTESIEIDGPVDFVYHFASPASPIDFERFPIQVLKAGALGTHKALGLAKAKSAVFVLASTSEVYGDPMVHPQPETYWGNVNLLGPRGVYDEGKRYAEAMTMAYHRFHGVDTRIVRFFNTYGPRMRLDDGRVVPNFVSQAIRGEPLTVYGDGSQTRSLGYYADILDGLLRLADSDYHEPVNIGSQEERTILEFARLVVELTNSNSEIVFKPALQDDPKQRMPDLTRANSILGWHPKTSIEEGMARTIDYFRSRIHL
jgi:dTDP-glucose 4,6-dehydratase